MSTLREMGRQAVRYAGEVVGYRESDETLEIQVSDELVFFAKLASYGELFQGKKPPGSRVVYLKDELSACFSPPDIREGIVGRRVRLDASFMRVLRWEFAEPTLKAARTPLEEKDYFHEFAELVRTFPIHEACRTKG